MKQTGRIASVAGIILGAILFGRVAIAQNPPQSEHESHHAAAQAQPSAGAQQPPGLGMGMMGGGGMMGGKGAMPMMSCCPCPMTGMGMMMGGRQDSKTAAKMMQMHAEMMKANAAIMEKYAKEMSGEK